MITFFNWSLFQSLRARCSDHWSDLALAPPGTDLETQIRTAASVHPSIEDQIGDGLAGTEIQRNRCGIQV